MTYEECLKYLPPSAVATSCFGNAGIGGYSEYWRTARGWRYEITNGPWDAVKPFKWSVRRLDVNLSDDAERAE